jgi:EAL domain-containing protein (putative c-di-GMP-specific phosphodiesterase class I)
MFSDEPTVQPRLLDRFEATACHPNVARVTGPDFRKEVRTFLERCTAAEADSIRAALIDEQGVFDPWSARPVKQVLAQLDSPWFSKLINNDGLRFHFQPIVDPSTFSIHGFEALARSAPPFEGYNPGEIIAAAKAFDALLKFDQVARRLAITQGIPKLRDRERLFVNFLPITIYDPQVCLETTFTAAREAGANFSSIVFEVVESEQFPDVHHLKDILDHYRQHGAMVGLDDLGAGNTSLTYIDKLMPDYIKIDGQLIKRAVADGRCAMVEGLVRHAKETDITVIAESIEGPEHLRFARDIGADLVQGFLIARPAVEPIRDFRGAQAAAA